MASDYIYRVVVKTTGSLQPSSTFWNRETVYCGPSLRDARVAYLRSETQDHGAGYGNRARETTIERHDAEPDDIATTDHKTIEA